MPFPVNRDYGITLSNVKTLSDTINKHKHMLTQEKKKEKLLKLKQDADDLFEQLKRKPLCDDWYELKDTYERKKKHILSLEQELEMKPIQ